MIILLNSFNFHANETIHIKKKYTQKCSSHETDAFWCIKPKSEKEQLKYLFFTILFLETQHIHNQRSNDFIFIENQLNKTLQRYCLDVGNWYQAFS